MGDVDDDDDGWRHGHLRREPRGGGVPRARGIEVTVLRLPSAAPPPRDRETPPTKQRGSTPPTQENGSTPPTVYIRIGKDSGAAAAQENDREESTPPAANDKKSGAPIARESQKRMKRGVGTWYP
ncbi:hypothetical protein CC2G_011208 [Coprinopsis cinerea AmutBmut pab1-1]|nr:hypothetical protein CC2G_011208 [Coprinopsis cinerea AmutBmut pab1-1]